MVSAKGGQYGVTKIEKGKRYKLRLINISSDNHFKVSLDNHPFLVVGADFDPITPYTTDWIFIAVGQRYDVIVTTNQTVDNYWLRAEVQDQAGPDCGRNKNNGHIKSIFRYKGASPNNPTSTATGYTMSCSDEVFKPYKDTFVPSEPLTQGGVLNTAIDIGVDTHNNTLVTWGINMTAMSVMWNKPTLAYVMGGQTDYPEQLNLISLPTANQVRSLLLRYIRCFIVCTLAYQPQS